MPLNKEGKSLKRKFEMEYGNRGDAIFYAWENKHKEMKRKLLKK